MIEKPTIVFVAGAWHGPESWGITRGRLEKLGYPTRAVRNPSLGHPDKKLEHDVANLREELERLSREGKSIVVMSHSYGGVIASCAVEGLSAYALPKGKSIADVRDFRGANFAKIDEDGGLRSTNPVETFYHDMDPSQHQKWISLLDSTPVSVFHAPSTYEPWNDMPCTFIFCTGDRSITPKEQREIVSMWGKEEVASYTINGASHSAFLSRPDEVVKAIERTIDVALRPKTSKI